MFGVTEIRRSLTNCEERVEDEQECGSHDTRT